MRGVLVPNPAVAQPPTLVRVSVALRNTVAKGPLGTKGFISAYSLWSIVKGSQGRRAEAETEVEVVEEDHLLACLP